tara:strand:+ start:488 stop:745 length:258 start_codon:yes stop_codon:yes gene_type:complete
MSDTEFENRILALEGQVQALRHALLSIPALLRGTGPCDLQSVLAKSVQLGAEGQMPLPDEIVATAFQKELLTIAAWLREDLETNP